MVVKVELADGTFEIFCTNGYKISKLEDMHPSIVKISVWDAGNLIFKFKRRFAWFYRHFVSKSEKVQKKLKEIQQEMEKSQSC